MNALELHRLALQQGISLAPGQIFSADPRFAHCVRINYGHPAQGRLEAALATVGQLATDLATAVPLSAATTKVLSIRFAKDALNNSDL